MADWPTIGSLATAGGTLVLALATFSSVRAGQRSTLIAERSTGIAERALLIGTRPVLVPSRGTDPPERVRFVGGRRVSVAGGKAAIERDRENYYFVIPLRNVGTGRSPRSSARRRSTKSMLTLRRCARRDPRARHHHAPREGQRRRCIASRRRDRTGRRAHPRPRDAEQQRGGPPARMAPPAQHQLSLLASETRSNIRRSTPVRLTRRRSYTRIRGVTRDQVPGSSPARAAGTTGVAGRVPTAAASRARKAPSSWIVLMSGAGKTTVEFLSTEISTRVWRLRSCSASGWATITSEARASSPAASASPSAAMILARFSRSASA